jgi:hypothetical protein
MKTMLDEMQKSIKCLDGAYVDLGSEIFADDKEPHTMLWSTQCLQDYLKSVGMCYLNVTAIKAS